MTDNTNSIIDAVIKAEGGSKFTDDPQDLGGRTQFGISERSNPQAWADGKVTEEEARAIYRKKYLDGPGFNRITDRNLQHLLVDWGVISGPSLVIGYLQRAVGAKPDGILGPKTAALANMADPRDLVRRLVIERVKMIGRIVSSNPGQIKWLNGWLNRALEFLQ